MSTTSPTHKNIKTISELEANTLAKRSTSEKIGDTIATVAGKMTFIVAHALWFTTWIVVNLRGQSGIAFDPYPFPLLTTMVSLESIFLSLFILMSQNRSRLQADERNHLELQINLLSEEENTKMIQMLQALCAHNKLPISGDPEIAVMAKRTQLTEVMEELKRNLPGNE